ncbi:Transcription factor IIIA [Frankliniella fusca]|uniref:Transcription factor IIIA n=1 Tax=Frankliniella fusca TaxID=407009 RepID=A0AAE1H288_9NEOP|nr:Transcription factor IIIA [Frankliniella fusca]
MTRASNPSGSMPQFVQCLRLTLAGLNVHPKLVSPWMNVTLDCLLFSGDMAANSTSCEASNHMFKEPWNKILTQAKSRSRRNRPWDKPPGNEVKQYSLSQTPRQLDVIKNDSVNIQSVTTISSRKHPSPEDTSDRKRTLRQSVRQAKLSFSVEQDLSGNESRKRTSRQNVRQAKRSLSVESDLSGNESRKRSSRQTERQAKRSHSVEWDWSGNESDSAKCPQNKRSRAPKARKRSPSLDSNVIGSDSFSDGDDDESSTTEGKECLICGKTFYRPWRLRVHLYRHIRIKGPFMCDEKGCFKTYFYKSHLDRHKSRNHAQHVITFQLKCQVEDCQKLFETGCGLKRHMKKMHSGGSQKFQCPQCEKSFSKNKQLRYHLAEHNGQPPLRCDKCNAGFYNDNLLRKHTRTHKEYPCTVPGCEQVFSNYSTLQKHISEHNKCFQSLQCAHCQRTFAKNYNLRQHVMTHLENKKVFKCTYESCGRVYYQERNLRSHIRVRHEKKSSFECPWSDCGNLFMSKRALQIHINVHENGRAKPVKKKEQRAPRKDKGQPKKAMATKLTGMMVPAQVEKQLLKESTNFKLSDTEPEECPARNTRSKSIVDIPLLIAGSSVVPNISQNAIITSQPFDDESYVNNSESSVLVDNSVIDNFTGCMFEVDENGFLVEVSIDSSKIKEDEDLTVVATEAPVLPVLDNSQQSEVSIACKDRSRLSSEPSPFPANTFGDTASMLSATLCAETIVECSSKDEERKVFILIPKTGQSAGESTSDINPEAVVQALSGDLDIYSVPQGVPTAVTKGDQQAECDETGIHSTVKKVSVSDPSVSSILQPLITKLVQLPKDKIQDIAQVSFLGEMASSEISNVSLNENACSLQEKENSSLNGMGRSMVRTLAHNEITVSQLSDVSHLDMGSSNVSLPFACLEGGGSEAHDAEFTGSGIQHSEVVGNKAEEAEAPGYCAEDNVTLCNSSPSDCSSGDNIQDSKAQDNTHSNDFTFGSVSTCSSTCSCCSTVILDRKSPRVRLSRIEIGKQDYLEPVNKSIQVEEENNKSQKTVIMDDASNLIDEEPPDNIGNKIESSQKRKKKQQSTDKQERVGTRHEAQLESKYSSESSDSEPLSEWLKNRTQATESKSSSDGDLSEASVSSCFESPKKKRKPLNFIESDSDDFDDPSWKPPKKKIMSKSKILNFSDSESENETGVDKKSSKNKSTVVGTQLNSSAPLVRKSSGIACRQLSESAWIDILRQTCRNLKLTLSATSTD